MSSCQQIIVTYVISGFSCD